MNWERWAPLTGVAFVVLAVVGVLVGGEPPDVDSPVQEVIDHYVDNKSSVQAGAFLIALAALLLVFFGGYLRSVLSVAEGPGGILSALTLVGLAIVAIGIAIDTTILFALSEAAEDIEPAAVQSLQALWDNDWIPFIVGTQVFLISAGLSIVRHAALPKWLGWAALVLAVIGFTPVGFVAFLAMGLWILIVSLILTFRGEPARA